MAEQVMQGPPLDPDRRRVGKADDQRFQVGRVVPSRITTVDQEEALALLRGVLNSPGQPLDPGARGFMESRFGHDFSRVRIHSNASAAASARAVSALAYTVNENVVFANGYYTPGTRSGRHLLAHELTHVLQQRPGAATGAAGSAKLQGGRHEVGTFFVQRNNGTSSAPPNIPVIRSFEELFAEFQEHLLFGRDTEAAALIPDLIAHMSLEEARRHAVGIAFWLMDRGDWEQARVVLRRLEDAWWIEYVTTGIPVSLWTITNTPRQLYERARAEAIAGQHEEATRLLGMAYLFIQFILHDASQQRLTQLESLNERVSGLGTAVSDVAGNMVMMSRLLAYQDLGRVYDLMRDILGLYPRLQRDAIASNNQELARRYSGLGLLVRVELRERYTISGVRGLTMESAATTSRTSSGAYEIAGRDLTTTETVTPLPGTRTPAELGAYPSYTATIESLFESIAGQEEYLTELFSHPEIRTEFRGQLPDMNQLSDRLRVWRTMYRVYEQERMNPLAALMGLIRQYMERFTFHSEYNIRDFGVSYLSTDFPEDLAGRAVRDCGVYALMTAYEVYRTARRASPRLNLDFRLYAMPEHVILVIFDRDEDNFYIVNNNQVVGPRRGEVLAEVARAYGGAFGRRFGVAPGVEVNLGSTSMAESNFRRQIWERYQVGTATGLRPEQPPGAGPSVTVGEATHYTYQRYYEDLARFDTGAQRLEQRLNELRQTIQGLTPEEARARLAGALPELTALGRALSLIFARRGPQADMIVDQQRARAVLGRGFARQLPEIIGEHNIYLFTEASRHPLARLAMALLHFQQLGGTLPTEAQNLIQALRQVSEFASDIDAYNRAGRPAAF